MKRLTAKEAVVTVPVGVRILSEVDGFSGIKEIKGLLYDVPDLGTSRSGFRERVCRVARSLVPGK